MQYQERGRQGWRNVRLAGECKRKKKKVEVPWEKKKKRLK